MSVGVSVCRYTCVYVCLCIYVCVYICACLYVSEYACAYMSLCVLCVCMCMCVYVCVSLKAGAWARTKKRGTPRVEDSELTHCDGSESVRQ